MKNPSHPIKGICYCKVFLMALFISVVSIATAQEIDFGLDPAANCPNDPFDITTTVGSNPNINIVAVGVPGGASVTMSIESIQLNGPFVCGGFDTCTPPEAVGNGLTVAIAGATATISGNITAAGETIVIVKATSTLDASVSCMRTYNISARKPVDLMLVLDNSASMNCCVNIEDETCVSCADPNNSRLKSLKDAVSVFLTRGQTEGYFLPGDRFAAVIFSGTLNTSLSTYTTDPAALNTAIAALGTAGGTCIGGGLAEGIDRMVAQSLPNNAKSLILFTDGEQNYNPMLNDTSLPMTYISPFETEGPYDPSDPNPPYGHCRTTVPSFIFNSAFRDTSPGIKISTIGIKLPPGPSTNLLANLANDVTGPGGTTYLEVGGAFNFDLFFTNAFVELLSGSSPQLVKTATGTTSSGINRIFFTTNDTLSKVSFMLKGKEGDGNSLRFKVIKDSVDVTQYGRIVDMGSYRLWSINLPVRRRTGASIKIRPGGKWTLQTSDTRAGINYIATCVVDDHRLDYECDFGDGGKHSPGKAIPLSVTLRYNNKPLKDAKVKVVIERHQGDGGTLLATIATPERLKSFATQNDVDPALNNLGQLKHYTLLKSDASYSNGLKTAVDTVVLTQVTDSTYTGSYTPTVTGVYKFTYIIDGEKPGIGKYRRELLKSSVVKLMRFDRAPKNFVLERFMEDGVFKGHKLNLILKDSSGLFLGPAFESAISFTSAEGKVGKVIDNLDGSYTILLTDIDESADPQIKLSVYGVEIYAGVLTGISGSAHTCPSWIPSFLAKLFHALGLNCIVGLIILMLLIIIIIWLIRRKK